MQQRLRAGARAPDPLLRQRREGIQHIGQRDIAWIRISKATADKGFNLEHFGKILHARFHADFGAIVDKVQVTIYTDPAEVAERLRQRPARPTTSATSAWPT